MTVSQKQMIREHAGHADAKDDRFDSIVGTFEEVQRLISWLGYVQENEYTRGERARIINSGKRFALMLQPIASKYLD